MIFINTEKIESEIERESGKNRTRFYQNGDIKRQMNREERTVKEKKRSKKEKKMHNKSNLCKRKEPKSISVKRDHISL